MKVVLVLTGAMSGHTVKLGNHQFIEGKCALEGNAVDVDSAAKVLARSYQAYPQGSDELIAAQARDEKVKGPADVNASGAHPTAERGSSAGVGGDGDGAPRPVQNPPAVLSAGPPLTPASGAEGVVSERDGLLDSGLQPEQVKKIKDALALLDPAVDAHWSETGLPSLEMLVEITKDQTINRAAVSHVAHQFNRNAAQTAKDIAAL